MGGKKDDIASFGAGKVGVGYDTFNVDFDPVFALDKDSYNISSGIKNGLAPRPGMSPIPGHCDTETLSSTRLPGLYKSQATNLTDKRDFQDRTRVFGVVPLSFGTYSDINVEKIFYAWIVGRKAGSDFYIDVRIGSVDSTGQAARDSGTDVVSHSPNIAAGLGAPEYLALLYDIANTAYNYSEPCYKQIPWNGDINDGQSILEALLLGTSSQYLSFDSISVSGRDIPCKYIVGWATGNPASSTKPAPCNFINPIHKDKAEFFGGGLPSCFNTRKFGQNQRILNFWMMDENAASPRFLYRVDYDLKSDPADYYESSFNQAETTTNIDATALGAGTRIDRIDAAAVTDNNSTYILLHDDFMVHNSSHRAILIAAKKPIVCIFQDWERNSNGSLNQWIDLKNNVYQPRNYATQNANGGSGDYTDKEKIVQTPFRYWPAFDGVTALGNEGTYNGTNQILLSAANTGLLRANQNYEFSYSLYNKKFGYESNVGTAVKFRTGTNDFVAITLYQDTQSAGDWLQIPAAESNPLFLDNLDLNYTEIRFYYRKEGSYEWIPALTIDAADFYYNPDNHVVYACQGAIAALPGGQPGAFNDYSPIPDDNYDHVLSYRGRAFWMSKKNLVFSLTNNIFAYALRNSFACPTGEFLGMKIHIYPGQSQQSSRLLIFGSKIGYVARFTGVQNQAAVQISDDTTAEFAVDGTDLILDEWSTDVPFSSRSAIVAEGVLYYWGPQGGFKDDGIVGSKKISKHIEPNMHTLYDPNRTEEIHCTYSSQTKEITWFYPPKTADATYKTYGLVLNIETEEFFPYKWRAKIDATQTLNIKDGDSLSQVSGERTLVIAREDDDTADPQRAYFFDYRNKGGDMAPGEEMLVKQTSSPATGVLRYTLAAGYTAAHIDAMAVNDLIALDQAKGYNGFTTAPDFIGKLKAKDSVAGTIDVYLPSGVTFEAASAASFEKYFQIYHQTRHGFPFLIKSSFWCPEGIEENFFWSHLLMLFQLDPLLASRDAQKLTVYHRPPNLEDYASAEITLLDNLSGHFLVFHALADIHNNGQGQQFKIAGTQFGGKWVLQYLSLHGTRQTGQFLKEYEE